MIEILFDLDGTLADYDGQLKKDLQAIASPYEPVLEDIYNKKLDYIKKRRDIITSQKGWWLNLPKFELGWHILVLIQGMFPTDQTRIQVLTKGPKSKPGAWSEKLEWCKKHLNTIIDGVTITHDKSLVYGRILVDDWPGYIEPWLENRPRGLVIMPAHSHNKDFTHPNVIRYDGTNIKEVAEKIKLFTEDIVVNWTKE